MSNQNMNQNNQNRSIFSTDHRCYTKTAVSRQRMLFDKVSENEMITKYNALREAYFKPTAGRSGPTVASPVIHGEGILCSPLSGYAIKFHPNYVSRGAQTDDMGWLRTPRHREHDALPGRKEDGAPGHQRRASRVHHGIPLAL
jgi:hypothetical protein